MRHWLVVLMLAAPVLAQGPGLDRLEAARQLLDEAGRLIEQRQPDPAGALLDRAAAEIDASGARDTPIGVERLAMLRLLRGRAAELAGRPDEARAAFEAVLTDYPDRPEVCGALGALLGLARRTGDVDRAESLARRIVELCPQSFERFDAEQVLVQRDLDAGRQAEATARVEAYRAARPAALEPYYLAEQLGWRLTERGDRAAAVELFGRLADQFAGTRQGETAAWNRVRLLVETGRLEEAERAAREALGNRPEMSAVADRSLLLAEIQARRGDWRQAVESLDELAAAYPGTYAEAEALERQARIFSQQGDGQAAREAAQSLLDGFEQPYFRVRGLSLLLLGHLDSQDLDGALAQVDPLVAMAAGEPTVAEPLIRLAWTCRLSGRVEDGERVLEALIDAYDGAPYERIAEQMREQWAFLAR